MMRIPTALIALALPAAAVAADYTLADGAVSIHAPDDWTAIMQKTEGDPQFVVFRIANPQSPGTLSRIGVNVRSIEGTDGFKSLVEGALAQARRGKGFAEMHAHEEERDTLRFRSAEEGEAQTVRLSYFRSGNHAIALTCSRPSNAPASAAWLRAFDDSCNALAAQLARLP